MSEDARRMLYNAAAISVTEILYPEVSDADLEDAAGSRTSYRRRPRRRSSAAAEKRIRLPCKGLDLACADQATFRGLFLESNFEGEDRSLWLQAQL
jgi:hypothetical protein